MKKNVIFLSLVMIILIIIPLATSFNFPVDEEDLKKHNKLKGLQGGIGSERFHLTEAERDSVQNITITVNASTLWTTDSSNTFVKASFPQNVLTTGNLTLGQKITFSFGEIIDNIVDGWIRITGGLDVTGNAIVQGNLTVDTNTLFIDSNSDRVGIGTNTPEAKLNIRNDDTDTGIALNPILILSNQEYTVNTGASLGFEFASGVVGAAITGLSTQSSGGGHLAFMTRSNTGVAGEHMRITNTGFVGIGTTIPTTPLEVVGSARITTSVNSPIFASFGSSGNSNIEMLGTGGVGTLTFSTSGSQAMHIDSSQNVIVGDTTTADGLLNVFSGSAGTVTARPSGDDFVIEHSTNGGMSILVPNKSTSTIIFGSPADPIGADLKWNFDNKLFIIGSRNTGSSLKFVSSNGIDAMIINENQSVGIGTITPTAVDTGIVLEIEGLPNEAAQLILGTDVVNVQDNEVIGALGFKNEDFAGDPPHYVGIKARANSVDGLMDLEFYTGKIDYELNTNPSMVILGNGFVGINTTTPQNNLNVLGDFNVTGNVIFDTATFFVDSINHRVGIGTAIPSFLLDVKGITRLGDGSILASSAAPTTDDMIANKKYVDDTVGSISIPAVILPTKEFFIPSTVFTPAGTDNNLAEWTNSFLNADNNIRFNIYIPADFSNLTSAVMVIIPDTTETVQFDVSTSFASEGELFTNHTDSIVDGTQGVTENIITELDISEAFTGIEAGDYVGVFFESDTSILKVIGFRFKYI